MMNCPWTGTLVYNETISVIISDISIIIWLDISKHVIFSKTLCFGSVQSFYKKSPQEKKKKKKAIEKKSPQKKFRENL